MIRKRNNEHINHNTLLKNKHPEEITKPGNRLVTVLRQYFDIVKIRRVKERKTGKRYSKAKDGPKLIGLLELGILMQYFDEAGMLIDYIKCR